MFSLMQHCSPDGTRRVIAARDGIAHFVAGFSDVRSLAAAAITRGASLAALVESAGREGVVDPGAELAAGRFWRPSITPTVRMSF